MTNKLYCGDNLQVWMRQGGNASGNAVLLLTFLASAKWRWATTQRPSLWAVFRVFKQMLIWLIPKRYLLRGNFNFKLRHYRTLARRACERFIREHEKGARRPPGTTTSSAHECEADVLHVVARTDYLGQRDKPFWKRLNRFSSRAYCGC